MGLRVKQVRQETARNRSFELNQVRPEIGAEATQSGRPQSNCGQL